MNLISEIILRIAYAAFSEAARASDDVDASLAFYRISTKCKRAAEECAGAS